MNARALALACGVAVLLASLGEAAAARLYRWKDKQGYTQYGDQPPPPDQLAGSSLDVLRFRNPPSALVRLRLEKQGLRYQAWADNLMHGPVEVQLGFRRQRDVRSAPVLPARAVVPARSSVLVADISVTDPLRGGDFELTLDGMPGDPASRDPVQPFQSADATGEKSPKTSTTQMTSSRRPISRIRLTGMCPEEPALGAETQATSTMPTAIFVLVAEVR